MSKPEYLFPTYMSHVLYLVLYISEYNPNSCTVRYHRLCSVRCTVPSVLVRYIPQVHTTDPRVAWYRQRFTSTHSLVCEYQYCRTRTRPVVDYVRECNASNTATTPNISDVCTAAAVDTACARGPVITYLVLVYQYEYVQGHCCLSKRTYRYSHEARRNEFNLSVEQYHTTYCMPGCSPACAQTKRSLAAPLRRRRLLLTVSCTL